MLEQCRLTWDTPGREVSLDNVWHIRISQEMLRHRFVIASVYPLPEG